MAEIISANINQLTHPLYQTQLLEWEKWRLVMQSGYLFKNRYLEKFSNGEDDDEFTARQKVSHVPAFAKAAVLEVKNAIYQRMSDISRNGGSNSYIQSIAGNDDGVDLMGSTMNMFIGAEVLEDLLSMGRIGIYIDMPAKNGETIIDNSHLRPYLYVYKAEDIRNWDYDETPTPNQFKAVLLRDYIYKFDENTHLPTEQRERYRLYYKEDNKVFVRFFDYSGTAIDIDGNENEDNIIQLEIERIPFIMIELTNDGKSLLTDIADYQISLLNLSSADMSYAIRANFPFYTEQFDPRSENTYLKQSNPNKVADGVTDNFSNVKEVNIGTGSGRRYPKELERPGFIHPSSEPMKASMEKQEQLKQEIRLLLHLSISSLQAKMASAESKTQDQGTLESGLSYIGLLLEDTERQIAQLWAMYENSKPATIHYPDKYNLNSDAERRQDVSDISSLLPAIPSKTYKKEIAKIMNRIMLGNRVSTDIMIQIEQEIDSAEVISVIPEQIIADVTAGLVDLETASLARGYPEGVVDKAKKDMAERLARIQAAQMPSGATKNSNGNSNQNINQAARGNPDGSPDPALEANIEKEKSQNSDTNIIPEKKVRGNAN